MRKFQPAPVWVIIKLTTLVVVIMLVITCCKKENEEEPVPTASISGVTVTPATSDVPKGYALEFTATVNGNNLSEANQTVTWAVTGGTKPGTAITADGTLIVANDETAQTLTVIAIPIADNSKSGTATVTVYEYQNFFEDATENSEIVEIEINGEKVLCNYIDGLYIIEGDIIIKDDRMVETNSSDNISIRAAMSQIDLLDETVKLWDEGKVYYYRQADGLTVNISSDVNSAIAKIQSATNDNIKFIELRTNAAREYKKNTRIVIVPSNTTNASHLGVKEGERQELFLHKSGPSALHEFGHALGLIHEHSRYKRDDYVKIHWDRILPGKEHNFKGLTKPIVLFSSDFDYESIMMYGSWDFSIWGNLRPTITKDDGKTTWIANRDFLTESDINVLKQMYPNRNASPDVFFRRNLANWTLNSIEMTFELIYEGYPAITEFDVLYREVRTNNTYDYIRQKVTTNNNLYTIQLSDSDIDPNKIYEVKIGYPAINGYKHPDEGILFQFAIKAREPCPSCPW